jgi:phage terminase large subunit
VGGSAEGEMTEITLPFTPREWQIPLMESTARNIVGVVHRQAGKSTAIIWRALRKALTEDRRHIPPARRNLRSDPPRVVHVLPLQVTWKKTGLWDKVERAADAIPGAKVLKSEFRVSLPNGGVYQCGGMDKPDNWRGGYADELIEDEADDVVAAGLDMVAVPMLLAYAGSRIKIGTPKGNGRLAKAYNSSPANARFLLPWQATGVYDADQVAAMKQSPLNPDGLDEEEFAQEMECSFTSPNAGSYYGKWLDAAIRDERICKVTYDPRLLVYTCWDLGMDDSTAIWWLQRSPGGEWRWLEYYEDSGPDLTDYAKLVLEKPYVYGKHYLPADIAVREMTYKLGRRHFLLGLGVKPIFTVPACNPADRIAAVRAILPRSFFDAEKCEIGLEKLRAYKRQWNEQMGIWRSEPTHDGASHAADSIGTGVQGSRDPENEAKPKIGPYVPRPAPPPSPGAWLRR